MVSPYRIPDDGLPRVINFSGGRSSGYMLYHILDAHDGTLPENVVVCFANTGREVSATLDFVAQVELHWDVPIVWLEYRWHPGAEGRRKGHWRHRHAVVDYVTASRNAEPYEAMIVAKSMLPNIAMSFCTTQLKVEPVNWYCTRELGWGEFRNVIGYRHDEPRRWRKALFEQCQAEYPMVHAKVDKPRVIAWWQRQHFDLAIHSDQGNCDLCFKKGRAKLVRLIRANPDLADWWIRMENELRRMPNWQEGRQNKAEIARFSKRFSYEELRDEAMSGDPLPAEQTDMLEEMPDCFCGMDDA